MKSAQKKLQLQTPACFFLRFCLVVQFDEQNTLVYSTKELIKPDKRSNTKPKTMDGPWGGIH